jgi:hypothetical protein
VVKNRVGGGTPVFSNEHVFASVIEKNPPKNPMVVIAFATMQVLVAYAHE